jgi:hypothetical protein
MHLHDDDNSHFFGRQKQQNEIEDSMILGLKQAGQNKNQACAKIKFTKW